MSNPFGLADTDMKTITAVLTRYSAVETAELERIPVP